MVKKLFTVPLLCLSLMLSPCGKIINPDIVAVSEAKTYVYYVPGSSYAYHASKNCWTLKRSKNIKKTTLKKAKKKLDLEPCGVCYK